MEDNVDIDKILVVTFTNVAASEMRQRILDAIYKKLEENPEDSNLQRQITLLAKSNICTIHSFCLEVIKNYFYEIGISPNFRIGDEAELEILKQDVLEELFENKYEKEDEEFLELINTYTGYRGDEPLKELILSIYQYIQSSPFPEEWITEKVNDLNLSNNINEDFSKTIWGDILLKNFMDEILDCIVGLKQIKKRLERFEELEKFSKIISLDIQKLEEIQNSKSWDDIYNLVQEFSFDRWPTDKKVVLSLKDEAKEMRDKIKKNFNKSKEKIFIYNSRQANEDINAMFPILNSLKNIVLEFEKEFSNKKREKNIIDFHDIEHFALNILVKKGENNEYIPTQVAKKYQDKFVEIAIDEYQDSNLVQEYILTTISKKNNIFMVGDVKQSIYRFRQARPELFLEKYEKYKIKENLKEDDGLKIQLFKNFRSRSDVLNITNLVFQDIMSRELGDINYDEIEYLNLGADYPKDEINGCNRAQLEIIDLKENEDNANQEDEEEERIENAVLEAKFVANEIKNILESNYKVYDRKVGYRKVDYKDIVILLRATRNVCTNLRKRDNKFKFASI